MLENVFWVSKKESTLKEAPRVCEYEEGEVGRTDSLVETGCVRVKALFCGGDGVLD